MTWPEAFVVAIFCLSMAYVLKSHQAQGSRGSGSVRNKVPKDPPPPPPLRIRGRCMEKPTPKESGPLPQPGDE